PAQKNAILLECPPFIANLHFAPVWGGLIACILTTAIALIVAIPLMRLTGMYATIGTLSVLVIANVVIGNWDSVTGGGASLLGIPQVTTRWLAFAGVILATLAVYFFEESRFGLRVRATRDDRFAARAVGIAVFWQRLLAFVISAFIVALSGVLYAHFHGTLTANTFYWKMTFVLISMLVVGGSGSLAGPLMGTLVMSGAGELLRLVEKGFDAGGGVHFKATGLRELGMAALTLFILAVRPRGLAGGK
ncbi:MAG: branched-chain amino acid ABC transporter permease, partial [Myxococcaceae bacterium]